MARHTIGVASGGGSHRSGCHIAMLPAPVLHQPQNFQIRDKNTLQANRCGGIGRHKEHIAAAQQALGAGLIENHAAIRPRCGSESNPGREVGLNQPGDYIYRGTLRGNHHMNSGGARQLRHARNRAFSFIGGQHHQIG